MQVKSRIISNITSASKDMNDRNLPAFAASVAFFFFISFIPTLMFGFSLMKYLPFSKQEVVDVLVTSLPGAVENPIKSIADEIYQVSGTVIPIALILTLWTAGKGMLGLVRGLNGILGLTDKRNFIVIRLVSVLYTLSFLAFIAVSILLAMFSHKIGIWMDNNLEYISPILHFLFKFRDVIICVFLAILLMLVYAFMPAERQKFTYQIPGALFGAVGWVLMTKLFNLYLDIFDGFSAYGSLATIIVILFWLDLIFTIILMGAYINMKYSAKIFEKHKEKRSKRIKIS